MHTYCIILSPAPVLLSVKGNGSILGVSIQSDVFVTTTAFFLCTISFLPCCHGGICVKEDHPLTSSCVQDTLCEDVMSLEAKVLR